MRSFDIYKKINCWFKTMAVLQQMFHCVQLHKWEQRSSSDKMLTCPDTSAKTS